MFPQWNLCHFVVACVVFGSLPGLNGIPVDPEVALAANPAVVLEAEPAAAVAANPALVSSVPEAVIAPASPIISTKAAPPPAPEQSVGGGVITQHKNPDGSVITVTRFEGPMPANAFQNPFASGLHNNLYQNHAQELLQLQQQGMMLQMQLMNTLYPSIPSYNPFPVYRNTAAYYLPYTSPAPYMNPYMGYGGGFMGFPFGGYPYGGQTGYYKSVK